MTLSNLLRAGAFTVAAALSVGAAGCNGKEDPPGYELAIRSAIDFPRISDLEAAVARGAGRDELIKITAEGDRFYSRTSALMSDYTLTRNWPDATQWMEEMREKADAMAAYPENRANEDTMRHVGAAREFYQIAMQAKRNNLSQLRTIWEYLYNGVSSARNVFLFANVHLKHGYPPSTILLDYEWDIRRDKNWRVVAQQTYAALPTPVQDGLAGWLGKYGPQALGFTERGFPSLETPEAHRAFGRRLLEQYQIATK